MRIVNIHEAKTHLSRLVEDAARGDSFIIAKAGKPIAKVVPVSADAQRPRQRFGFATTSMSVPEDFDRMGEGDIEALFGLR